MIIVYNTVDSFRKESELKATETLQVRVECYADYQGEDRPERFYLKSRCIEVIEIIDQWAGPDYRYVKLRGNDSGIYILRHSIDEDTWELTLFDSGQLNVTRLSQS